MLDSEGLQMALGRPLLALGAPLLVSKGPLLASEAVIGVGSGCSRDSRLSNFESEVAVPPNFGDK